MSWVVRQMGLVSLAGRAQCRRWMRLSAISAVNGDDMCSCERGQRLSEDEEQTEKNEGRLRCHERATVVKGSALSYLILCPL